MQNACQWKSKVDFTNQLNYITMISKESNFALQLVKAGYEADEVEALLTAFGTDGRIDPRSSNFQIALLNVPEVKKAMLEGAAEIIAKREGKKATQTVEGDE